MNHQLLSLCLFLGILLLLIGATELLHKAFKWPAEQSRKFLHVSGGITCLFLPVFFSSHWWVLALSSLAFLLLLVTYRNKLLDSIHKTKRRSIGSVIFPIPVYACFLTATLLHNDLFFYLPICLLTISDTAAETAGNKWGHLSKQFFNGQKTLAGSIGFFVTALLICFFLLYYYDLPLYDVLLATILISILATITELVTLKGWDNLTVPVVTNVILYFFVK